MIFSLLLVALVLAVLVTEGLILRRFRQEETAMSESAEEARRQRSIEEESREAAEQSSREASSRAQEESSEPTGSSETPEETETEKTEDTEDTAEQTTETSTVPEIPPGPEDTPSDWAYTEPADTGKEPFRDGLRVWVGDSRMVGLQYSAAYDPSKDLFVCKGAMSYQWFQNSAVPELERILSSRDITYVLINMGLNDCANNCKGYRQYTVVDYINTINDLIARYPGTRFCFLSVGLTDGVYRGTYPIEPEELMVYIDNFNFNMYTYCGARFIPVSRFIEDNGFRTADGVHYGSEVNRSIYNYVLDFLKGD